MENENNVQVVKQTFEEKVEMYMKMDHKKVCEMLAQCNMMHESLQTRLYNHIPVVEPSKLKIIPYQVCPKCNGTGLQFPDFATADYIMETCKVCNGAKVIPMHVVENE